MIPLANGFIIDDVELAMERELFGRVCREGTATEKSAAKSARSNARSRALNVGGESAGEHVVRLAPSMMRM